MSLLVLNNVSISARRHAFVCLLLFVLSLFSMAMATNSMMSPSSNMMSMEAHTHVTSELSAHDMSFDAVSYCVSTAVDECSSLTSEHNHQNCMDNHCSSFSGLLASYLSDSDYIPAVHTTISSEFYLSTYPNTPYFPPIVIS